MYYYEFDIDLDGWERTLIEDSLHFNLLVKLTDLHNCNGHQEVRVISSSKQNIIDFIMYMHGEDEAEALEWFKVGGGRQFVTDLMN